MRSTLAILIVSILGFAGCGSNETSTAGKPQQENIPCGNGQKCLPRASEALQPFLFATEGSCEQPDGMRFKLASARKIALGKDDKGRDVEARIELYLFHFRGYVVAYDERVILSENGNRREVDIVHESRHEGNWSESGEILALGDLGTATIGSVNETPTLSLTFAKPINDSRLQGVTALIQPSTSTRGPNDESPSSLCE